MTAFAISQATELDVDVIEALLTREHLPVEGLHDHLDHTLVARDAGRIVGCAALEIYEDGALLRSVAVDAAHRGAGVGVALTQAALARAASLHVEAVYLLTTTAERFFPRFGFVVIDRAEVPAAVRSSWEFSTGCSTSAIVMRKVLTSPT